MQPQTGYFAQLNSFKLLLGFLVCTALPAYAETTLSSDQRIAKSGYFTLTWISQQVGPYELIQSQYNDFSVWLTRYQGHDTAMLISGLPNGDYYFRVRALREAWSEPIQVTVSHHSLNYALWFFIAGAIMFLILTGAIICGSRLQEK